MILDDVHRGITKHKVAKRIGRGPGSGHGKTSGRGHKGYFSRSGASRRTGFEGGQTPLFMRIAKRGFSNNAFRLKVAVINVSALNEAFESGAAIELLLHQAEAHDRLEAGDEDPALAEVVLVVERDVIERHRARLRGRAVSCGPKAGAVSTRFKDIGRAGTAAMPRS